MIDDGQLLRQYLEERSEAAFTELVRRHLGVVYHSALRRVGGDRHLADDVAQSVFADLARKAPNLRERAVLIGWLYTSTRFAAAQAVRTARRRRFHEQEGQALQELHGPPESGWEKLRPVIDEALDELNEPEREIVLLRFFESLPLAEVGSRFSISADAARMRIDRALEKLRGELVRRGIASTSAALAAVVATQSGLAVPPGMAARIAGSILHPTGAATAAGVGLGKIAGGLAVAAIALGFVAFRTDLPRRLGVGSPPVAAAVTTVTAAPPAPEETASAATGAAPAAPARSSRPASLAAAAPAAAATAGFAQLAGPARDILKSLWTVQETSGMRVGLRVGANGENFATFSAGRAALFALGFATTGPKGGVRLTNSGVAFCEAHRSEIDAYPDYYHLPRNPPREGPALSGPE